MPRLLSAREIAERALRKIGTFPITDSAADGGELEEALYYLDLLVQELAGVQTLRWLVPRPFILPLTAEQAEYNLAADFVGILPPDAFQYPLDAVMLRSGGHDAPVIWLRRSEYERISDKTTPGTPAQILIDRQEPPRLFVHKPPADGTWSLRLTTMVYPADMTGNAGNVAHGFPAAWELWLVHALAAEIGDGPVRRCPMDEIEQWRKVAMFKREELLAYHNRERQTGGFVKYRDF